jgi:hypothetical protein
MANYSNGYGTSRYGLSPYGLGDLSVTLSTYLIIQPASYSLRGGATFQIAGIDIYDHSRDDTFPGSVLSLTKWVDQSVGGGNVAVLNGIQLQLGGNVGDVARLMSLGTFVGGIIGVNYHIESDVIGNAPTIDTHFAAVTIRFSDTEYLRLSRRYSSVLDEHQVGVKHVAAGAVVADGSVPAEELSGSLSWAFWNNTAYAYYGDTLVWTTTAMPTGNPTIWVEALTESGGYYLRTNVDAFYTNSLVLMGEVPAITSNGKTKNRVIGTIPVGNDIGTCTVSVHNWRGLVGQKTNVFEYLPSLPATLRNTAGNTLSTATDKIVRDRDSVAV